MPPQQSLADRWKAKQQPLKPTQSLADRWKAKQTPNPPPTSPTEKPGFLSRAWDASRDLAEGFAGQLYMGMNPGGAGSIAMGQGLAEPWVEAYQDTSRDPRARFGRAASKMIGLNPDAIEEDWEAGNYGGVAGGIAPALVAGVVAHKVGGNLRAKAAGNVGKLAYDPNVRLPSQPYDVPFPPGTHDVQRWQSPWPNEKVPPKTQPFDVERPPSPYNVPLPPPPPPPPPAGSRILPERAGMGTQDLYPRGPRTAPTPLLGLGEGTPVRETPFRAGPTGGQPVTNLNDPSNIDIFGQSIDPSITAQNTVRNPPVQPGFNPALRQPGTTMPLGQPVMPIPPPPVEPVVAPTPAKAGKVGRRPKNAITPDAVSPEVLAADEAIPEFTKPVKAKVVQPVKPPKPIPIGKYTDDMLIERVKLGTATPEIQAEIAKRIAKKEKAAAAAPIVQQPIQPTQPTAPVVEPPVVQPPVRTLPKVEPVAVPDLTPAPDVTPVGAPVIEPPVAPPVAPPKAAKEKVVTVPKSVINRLDRALAEAKTVYKEALKDVKGYRSPMQDETMDPKWNEFNDKLNAARKALTAATKAKVKAVSVSEPVIEPVVEPVKAAPTRPTLPKVEPIQGLDLSGHTREQLIELARTADEATSLTIRSELAARRKASSAKAGTNLGSGFGSLQDAPRILKQEFDDWRVLKNLPENQAAFEEFLRDTGRGAAVTFKRSERFEEHYKKGEQELRETNNVRDLKGLRGFWEGQKGMYVYVDNAEATSWASQLIADIDTKIKSLEKFERETPVAETPKKSIVPDVDQSVLKEERRADYKESIRIKAETDVNKAKANWFYWEDEILKHLKSGNKDELILARQMAREAADHLDDIRGIKRHVPEPLSEVVKSEKLPAVTKREEELRAKATALPEVDQSVLRRMDTHYKDDTPIKGESPMEEMKRLAKKGMTPEGETRLEVERFRKLRNEYAEQHGIDPFDEAFEQLDTDPQGYKLKEHKTAYDTKPVPKVESELPEIEPVLPPLESLSTKELMEFARSAVGRLEEDAVRAEVARRRANRKGTTIHSTFSALTDAGPILKKEFDQWRVLKELPENQEAFDQFLKDTGKAGRIVLKGDKLEEQKWEGPAKNVKISTASIPDVDIPKEPIPEFGSRASKTLGKLDYPDMPTAARRVGRTISDVDLGEESRFGKRGTGREIPEAKPPVLTERFQQGIVDPKREDLKGLSVREIAAKAGELAKREAEQAAIERGRQEAIEDRKRAKITAQIVRREDRLRERKKKIDEKKAKVAEKKAAKKAAEIPPADVTETGRGLFGGNRKFMNKNLPFKEIMDKFVSHRSAGQPIVKSVTDKFKNIKKFTKKQVVEFQDAVEAGQYPAVRKFYDDLHDRLTSQGIELGKKENYLPQLWENTPAEVKAAFGDKQMNSKASFQHRSYIEDYRTGIEKGLKPKLSPLEQMTWYAERANKLEADHAALKALKAKGYLIKVGELKPGSGMKELDSSLGAFKGYAAHPEVKHVIENYLKQADFGSGFAKATGKLANLRLSSGVVPFTPIMTAHGGNIARPFFSRSFAEGGVRRNLKALKYGFNPRAAEKYLVSKGDQIVADTQEFGYSSNVSEPAGTQGNYFEGEKPGRIKRGLNWLSRGQYKAFERNLFEKMLPAIKHEAFTDNMKQFQKQGMSRAKAGKAAVDVTDHFYSGKNIDLLYNNKHFNNVARILTLAPGWLRSSVDLGIQIPKSFAQAVTKEGRNSPIAKKYRSAGYNLLGTYVAANIAQKMVNGKFMVENEPSEIFTFQAGETSDGKTRGVDLYGSAFDFGEIPAKMAAAALGGEKSKSLGEVASRSVQYKASPPIQALIDFSKGTDFRGETNLAGTTDRFGNYIPTSQRAKNTLSQVINFGPPQVANPINYFSGRAGLEESIARIAEMNLTYKHKKKSKSSSPLTMPSLQGLPAMPRMR